VFADLGNADTRAPAQPAVLVVLPTFNERASLESVVRRIRDALPQASILIVDDASPDGTGALADQLASHDLQFHVLHRANKEGLGRAYLAGFAWAFARDFEVIVEFDADGSHQPEQLPRLLDALTPEVSLVIGTRWMPGGAVHNWPRYRRFISRAATRFARASLRSTLRDITSGMRAFRVSALRTLNLDDLSAHGYCFQIELAWSFERNGFAVAEVPIDFVEREQGRSKMSLGVVLEALWLVTWWGVKLRLGGFGRGNRI